LKTKYGSDLRINSGFRIGKGTSQHETGQAVDVSFVSANSAGGQKKIDMTQEKAIEIKNSVSFDQIILESSGPGSAWVHVSYNSGGNRPASNPRKIMTYRKGSSWGASGSDYKSGLGF
jgi:hypothetical protein